MPMSPARVADIRDYLPAVAASRRLEVASEVFHPEPLGPTSATAIFGAGMGAGVLLAIMALIAAAML